MLKKGLFVLLWTFLISNFTFASNDFFDFVKNESRMSQDTWLDYSSDKNVVKYLYQNNMTKYDKVSDFRGSDTILRAEVTKFFTRFAKAKWFVSSSNNNCNFSDISNTAEDLKVTIKEACQMWLFNGNKWKFNPYWDLTYWEALAVTIRMIDWAKLSEGGSHWAMNYLKKANSYMMRLRQLQYAESNPSILNQPISRIDMWRLLEWADFYKLQLLPVLEKFKQNIR